MRPLRNFRRSEDCFTLKTDLTSQESQIFRNKYFVVGSVTIMINKMIMTVTMTMTMTMTMIMIMIMIMIMTMTMTTILILMMVMMISMLIRIRIRIMIVIVIVTMIMIIAMALLSGEISEDFPKSSEDFPPRL